jgi:hypothetical protein
VRSVRACVRVRVRVRLRWHARVRVSVRVRVRVRVRMRVHAHAHVAGPPIGWLAGWEFPLWGPTPWGRAAPKLARIYRGGNRRRRCAGYRRAGRRAAASMAGRLKQTLVFLSTAQRGELLTTPALAARQFGRVV